jgi:GntR family transcriptional regulator/MocR family aminotransferase
VREAQRAGLGPLALSALRAGRGGRPGLVLGYAAQTPDRLTSAVRRLAQIVQ